jgi:hypothetical protein
MVSCKGCGAEIGGSDSQCPYCGHSSVQHFKRERVDAQDRKDAYMVRQDEDGMTHVHFGDGGTGARPTSGKDKVSAAYRRGAGSYSLFTGEKMIQNWDRLDQQLEMVPDTPDRHSSASQGQVLLEVFSTIGKLLSLYQGLVAGEAHLSTQEKERLTKSEKKTRPRLEALVVFCDAATKRFHKQLQLRESDLARLKQAIITLLGLMDIDNAGCSTCGTENKPGATRCTNCGAPL